MFPYFWFVDPGDIEPVLYFFSYRFDKLVYVGINEDKESQLQVLKAILRKWVTLWVTQILKLQFPELYSS